MVGVFLQARQWSIPAEGQLARNLLAVSDITMCINWDHWPHALCHRSDGTQPHQINIEFLQKTAVKVMVVLYIYGRIYSTKNPFYIENSNLCGLQTR